MVTVILITNLQKKKRDGVDISYFTFHLLEKRIKSAILVLRQKESPMTMQRKATIHQPSRHTMQIGLAKTKQWVLDFVPTPERSVDPLMGWTSSRDTLQQLRLTFETQAAAVAYATQNNIDYQVLPVQEARPQTKAYADNFAARRLR
jgi:hypothetical protein